MGTKFVCSQGKGRERKSERVREKRRNFFFFFMCLDIRKKGLKKMCKFYISFIWFAQRRKRKNTYFYLYALIKDGKIYQNTCNFLKVLRVYQSFNSIKLWISEIISIPTKSVGFMKKAITPPHQLFFFYWTTKWQK